MKMLKFALLRVCLVPWIQIECNQKVNITVRNSERFTPRLILQFFRITCYEVNWSPKKLFQSEILVLTSEPFKFHNFVQCSSCMPFILGFLSQFQAYEISTGISDYVCAASLIIINANERVVVACTKYLPGSTGENFKKPFSQCRYKS